MPDDLTRQTLRMAIDDMKQTLKDSHHVSKEWADMIRQVIRLWEKKLEEVEVITKLDKALQNTTVVKRVLVENSCPSQFGLEDCEFNPKSGCTLCCEDCWNQEVGE